MRAGFVSKDLARVCNDLFERRQEGDYVDFVFFKEEQVLPWLSDGEQFVQEITTLINQKTSNTKMKPVRKIGQWLWK